MIRKQVHIEKRQDLLIKRPAQARGVNESEVIRQVIDRLHHREVAWKKALALMRSLRRLGSVPRRGQRWIREDLYEDRETGRVRSSR